MTESKKKQIMKTNRSLLEWKNGQAVKVENFLIGTEYTVKVDPRYGSKYIIKGKTYLQF